MLTKLLQKRAFREMQSQEIRQLVQKEGKSARNLVTWSVPATDVSPTNSTQNESNDGFQQVTKKTRRTRQRRPRGSNYQEPTRRQKPAPTPPTVPPPVPVNVKEKKAATPAGSTVSEEVCVVVAEHYSDMHTKQRQTRASSKPLSSKVDLHARYWSYLFDNLHRAVDELYATCEADESVIECQEVIMTLELCQKDFEALIRRFQLFEQQQLQPKPSNLAWEVRKTTSPIKVRSLGLRQSLSPSSSPSHHPQPHSPSRHHQSQLHVPSHHHDSHTDTTQPLRSHQDTSSHPPRSQSDAQPGRSRQDTASQPHHSHSDAPSQPHQSLPAISAHNLGSQIPPPRNNTSRTTGPTNEKPAKLSTTSTNSSHSAKTQLINIPPRPSSARSLDFITCSSEGRVSSPILKRSKSHGKAESEARKSDEKRSQSKIFTNGPTWADRVRGLAKPSSDSGNGKVKTSVSDSVNVSGSQKEVRADEEGFELEDGWERVTRFRSRSASSSSKSGRNGHSRSTTHSRDSKLKSKTKSSDTARSSSTSSSEPVTPIPEDPIPSVSDNVSNTEPSASDSVMVPSAQDPATTTQDPVTVPNAQNPATDAVLSAQDPTLPDSITECDAVPHVAHSAPTAQVDSLPDKTLEVEEEDSSPMTVATLEASEISLQELAGVEEDKEEPVEPEPAKPWTWNEVMADYEAGESYRQEVGWADRCDSPPEVLPEIPRSPGRAIHLHQRLSSPSRRRLVEDVEESRRQHLEKQNKAEQTRSRIQEEKTQKYKIASDKVREARESRDARIRQQREALEGKLQRAEMLRESHLQEIVRKAQEEEAKVSEISFINTLEAQNKKMEVLERHEVHKARLQELQDERQRKREEQLAKEEAALERRRLLESERVAKLMEQEVKRKEQEAKIEQMRQERERVREDTAREKAKERERKLVARNAAIQTSVEELERKIQQKHHESSRRYGQQLEQKKMVAVSISRHTSSDDAPKVEVYKKKKWCTLCDVGIISEVYLLSHLRGRKHQEALAALSSEVSEDAPVIIEADEEQQRLQVEKPEVQERLRVGKKRAKKIRHRMASRMKEEVWPGPSAAVQSKNRPKLQRSIKDLNRHLDTIHSSTSSTPHTLTWEPSQLTHIERCLGDLSRCLSGGGAEDRLCFCQLGGLSAVLRLFVLAMMDGTGKKRPSDKALLYAISVLQASCPGHQDNCTYLVFSNKMAPLIDLSLQLLSEVCLGAEVGGASPGSKAISICGGLIRVLAGVVSTLATGSAEKQREELSQPLLNLISYLVSVGLVDKLGEYFESINGPIGELPVIQLVLYAINLIVAITASMHTRVTDVFSGTPCDDPSLLTVVLHQTELVRLMQLLYAVLLHDGPPRHSSTPPPLTQHTLAIATAAVKAVNNSAILDLQMVQSCLGAEGISLEFRHVVSYLLWYCSHNKCPSLLHELILAVGYFCVFNRENQVFLQSGRSPTLLQLLCDLPFEYFSSPDLTRLLYPTLISACYRMEENVCILEQEISCKLLVAFLQETIAKEKGSKSKPDHKSTQGQSVDFNALQYRFPRSDWQDAINFFNR